MRLVKCRRVTLPHFMSTPLAAGEAVPFLRQITVVVLAAAVFGLVCQRVKVVPIVGFLLAGVLIGPNLLGRYFGFASEYDGESHTISALAEYGVILLLFTIGIEFSLEKLAAIKRLIFGAGTLQVVGTVTAVTLVLLPFAGWRAAVFTGCLVALSSTAIVLKLLGDGGRTNTPSGQAALGVLIFQDLAVVAMVMLVPMLAPNPDGERGGAGALAGALAMAGATVAVVILFARRVVPILLEFVARTCRGEIFFLSVVAICVTTAYLTSLAGISAALGAFLAGLVVSESKFRHHAFGEIMPLQILFSAAFFVSVGMLLDPMFVARNVDLVLLVVSCVLVLKVAVTTLALKLVGRPWRESAAVGLTLGQVGEFAFVLGTAGVAAGLLPMGRDDGFDLFIAASVVLMLATPLLARLGQQMSASPAVEAQAGELADHVIIVGLGTGGKAVAEALRASGRPHTIVTLDPAAAAEHESAGSSVMRGATDRSPSLEHAGADRAALVVIADDDVEITQRAAAIARWHADRGGNGTRVIARLPAGEGVEHEAVLNAGADDVFEAGDAELVERVRLILADVPIKSP